MGREIRMVPANWEHPTMAKPNLATGRMEELYQPMFDQDVESAMVNWLEEYQRWIASERAATQEKHHYPADEPYRSFCDWHSKPPDPKYYRPKWGTATWYQVYETVSEGTPVTPPFVTKDELIEYLATKGDFWDQQWGEGPWKRESAEKFVNGGYAPSLVVIRDGKGGVEEYKVDKSKWPRGVWDDEPDRLQWVYQGLDCIVIRQKMHGAWCGYVGVPVGHPVYGKSSGDVEANVHGGINYANKCHGHICRVPEDGRPDDVFWLGFDCLHGGDQSPAMPACEYDVYRDVAYVKGEVESLADQLAAMGGKR